MQIIEDSEVSAAMVKASQRWGFAGVPSGAFEWWRGDSLINRLNFTGKYGFHVAPVGYRDLTTPERIDEIAGILDVHNLMSSMHLGVRDLTVGRDALRAEWDVALQALERHRDGLRIQQVHFCVGPYHRFMRAPDPSLEEQMEVLYSLFSYAVPRLADMGLRLAIENHGDYYLSDLVALCERVPGLGILLDTGNCCLVGERPVEACRDAAPYVFGTHLKDHRLSPGTKGGLSLQIDGAALGDGDCGLETILADLFRLNPAPEKLVMEVEWVPGSTEDHWESFHKSRDFIRRVGGGALRS